MGWWADAIGEDYFPLSTYFRVARVAPVLLGYVGVDGAKQALALMELIQITVSVSMLISVPVEA